MIASTAYDGLGSCSVTVDDTTNDVSVTVEDDPGADNGYFAFALENGIGETVTITISNLSTVDFHSTDTLVVVPDPDTDHKTWTRTDTVDGGATATLDTNKVVIAAEPFYPYQATVDRVTQLRTDYPNITESEVIGQSQQGRDMYALRITDPNVARSEKTDIVVLTRHHGGEAAPSHNMDGMIDFVINEMVNNGRAFDRVFHFIPHVNPDGIYHGWERNDSDGIDLNREWDDATMQPEIANCQTYIQNNVVDYEYAVDLHSGNPPNGAVYYDSSYSNAADVEKIQRIADANVYMDGLHDTHTSGTSREWFNEYYNDHAITSEIYQFKPYTVNELEVTEGQTWMDIITEEPPEATGPFVAQKSVRQNGAWVQ